MVLSDAGQSRVCQVPDSRGSYFSARMPHMTHSAVQVENRAVDRQEERLIHVEQMLEVLTRQAAELQRLAALAAKDPSPTVNSLRKTKEAAPRLLKKR